jgi:UDP-N-acetyl-D-mannosaminuronic acid dehydrogenase
LKVLVTRAINNGMPLHMADLTVEALREAGVEIKNAKVAVLGYAYLEISDDTRNSPSEVLVARLQELGAEVVVHDPYVLQGGLREMVWGCDAVALMVAHAAYRAVYQGKLRTRVARPILTD